MTNEEYERELARERFSGGFWGCQYNEDDDSTSKITYAIVNDDDESEATTLTMHKLEDDPEGLYCVTWMDEIVAPVENVVFGREPFTIIFPLAGEKLKKYEWTAFERMGMQDEKRGIAQRIIDGQPELMDELVVIRE